MKSASQASFIAMENQAKALQQPAINVTLDQDNTQQLLLSKAELNAGMDFLRAAGLDPMTLVQDADIGAATANSPGVADAIKSMGKDIADKMEEFGQRLALLDSRSAGPRADHHVFDTSTPRAPEVRKDGSATPAPSQQLLLWADWPLDETPNYSLQLSWDDEEPRDESATTSN